MKKVLKENKYIILGFIVPLIMMIWVMMVMQFAPFGLYSLLISDGAAQEIDRITGFRDIVLNHKSFFYSWGQIQGSTPFAFINFNPSYLLFLLVPEAYIVDMVTWTTILKIAFAGGTCAFYLKKTFNRNDIGVSIFAWCYAMMGYGFGFHFILGWEEQLVMLPLVLYGVEKILKNRKHFLFFTMSLTMVFFMYYYFGFMTGVFSFIYFIYRYLSINKEYKMRDFLGKLGSFMISPILAFGCTSFLLLPIMYMLSLRDNIADVNNFGIYLRYEFEDLIAKLFVGSFDTYLPNGLPFIYCGIIVLIFIGIYFCSHATKYKDKLLTFCFLAFMLLSLTFNPLYVAWQGFKPPVYFEARFSYLVCFLMIFIAYQGYCKLQAVSSKRLHLVFGVIGICFIAFQRQDYSFVGDQNVLYTLAFIAIYFTIALLFYKVHYDKKKLAILLALIVTLELTTNASLTFEKINEFSPYPFKEEYVEATEDIQSALQVIRNQDEGFYRIEFTNQRGMNDGFGQGYASISHFDSTYNYNVKEGIGAMGMLKGHNWLRYIGSTPVLDLLLNVKYVVTEPKSYFTSYEQIGQSDNKEGIEEIIYRNPYALSIGFMSHSSLDAVEHTDHPLALQEEMLNKIAGQENVTYYQEINMDEPEIYNLSTLPQQDVPAQQAATVGDGEEISAEASSYVEDVMAHYYKVDTRQKGGMIYHLTANREGAYFMDITQVSNSYPISIYVNGERLDIDVMKMPSIVSLGQYQKGEVINVEIRLESTDCEMRQVSFYYFEHEKLTAFVKEMSPNKLQVTNYSDTVVEGEIEVTNDAPYLYTSIPYDEGWQVYIDGKLSDAMKIMNIFLGTKLAEGKHTVRFVYEPVGWTKGIIISILSWVVIFLMIIVKKTRFIEKSSIKKIKIKQKKD